MGERGDGGLYTIIPAFTFTITSANSIDTSTAAITKMEYGMTDVAVH